MSAKQILLSAVFLTLFGQAVLAQTATEQKPKRISPEDIHLALGNPSKATQDFVKPDRKNFLLVKPQFALSYNAEKGTPNWVSYRLRREDMGRAPRPMEFFPEDEFPRSFYMVKPFDYHFQRTGMSRGHMCPNGHRNNTAENARSTFVMSNMVPQTEELNDGAWKNLEIYCGDLAFQRNREMHIICGPHGVGGTSDKGRINDVGNGRVVVPKSCWKVILVVDARSSKPLLERIDRNTRILAVVMPNDRTPENQPWTKYAVSCEQVEQLTGYRFFDRVPADVIGPLKKLTHRSASLEVERPAVAAAP